MRIATAATTDTQSDKVAGLLKNLVDELGAEPDLLIVYCTEGFDLHKIISLISTRYPDTQVHGGTSCHGVMTELGLASEGDQGIGMMGVSDADGSYGVGIATIEGDAVAVGEAVTRMALEQADCPGEVPAMVLLTSAPGSEEQLIEGIGNVIGSDVPVGGGSAADNTVTGKWKQFSRDTITENGVVVTVLFPSTEVLFAFHSGYEPTGAKGVITKSGGFVETQMRGEATKVSKRILVEIDNMPAAQVYNEWTKGAIHEALECGGNILQQSTLNPLGKVAGFISDVPYYQLTHPDTVTPDGAITLFADIDQGDEVVLMQGTIESLISRAGRVALSALETNMCDSEEIAGAFVVYCAGCMLAVQHRLDEVVESFRIALPGVPFLGTFSFGEQGCFLSGESRHGNLMISVLLITKDMD